MVPSVGRPATLILSGTGCPLLATWPTRSHAVDVQHRQPGDGNRPFAWSAHVDSCGDVGGLIVGLVALRKVRVDRTAWLYCLGWFLILQLLSRVTTPVEMNVNVSHAVYQGWQQIFTAYWKFWLVATLLVAIGFWFLGLVLSKLWPAQPSVS